MFVYPWGDVNQVSVFEKIVELKYNYMNTEQQ